MPSLQGIFPTQGLNLHPLHLQHSRWTLDPLSHLGSPSQTYLPQIIPHPYPALMLVYGKGVNLFRLYSSNFRGLVYSWRAQGERWREKGREMP